MSISSDRQLQFSIAVGIAVFLLLRLAFVYLDVPELWGINYLAYLNESTAFILAAAGFLVLVPSFAGRIWSGFESFEAWVIRHPSTKYIVGIGIAVVGFVLFERFAVAYPFLGDGKHVVTTMNRLLSGSTTGTGTLWLEPGTVYLLSNLIAKFGVSGSGNDLTHITEVFQQVGFVLGAIFTGLYALYAFSWRQEVGKWDYGALLLLAVLGCGGTLFFFGYIEYYVVMYGFGVLFLYQGVRELKTGRPPTVSGLFFILAVVFHLSALVFLPALMYLILHYAISEEAKLNRITLVANLCIIIAAVTIYIWMEVTSGVIFFIPLIPSGSNFGLLTLQHFLDILNNLLIHAPIAIIIVLVITIGYRSATHLNGIAVFAFLAAFYWFALTVVHSAIARDWDVYALLGPSIVFLAIALLNTVKDEKTRQYTLVQLGSQSILILIPWVLLNASDRDSFDRYVSITKLYETILPKDVTAGHYETIRTVYATVGDIQNEIHTQAVILEYSNDPYEMYKMLLSVSKSNGLDEGTAARIKETVDAALNSYDKGDLIVDEYPSQSRDVTVSDLAAMVVFETASKTSDDANAWASNALDELGLPSHSSTLTRTADKLFNASRYGGALVAYNQALVKAEQENVGRLLSHIHARMANILKGEGRKELFAHHAERAISFAEPTAEAYAMAGYSAVADNDIESAVRLFDRALRMDSTELNSLFMLGQLHMLYTGNPDKGILLLNKLIHLQPDSEQARIARDVLQKSVAE